MLTTIAPSCCNLMQSVFVHGISPCRFLYPKWSDIEPMMIKTGLGREERLAAIVCKHLRISRYGQAKLSIGAITSLYHLLLAKMSGFSLARRWVSS